MTSPTSIKTILKNTVFYTIPLFLFIISGLIAKTIYTKNELFLMVNQYAHNGVFAEIVKICTNFGDGLFAVAISVVFALFVSYKTSIEVLITYAIPSLITQIIKKIVHAPRPLQFFEDQGIQLQLIEGVKNHRWNSFPSGHSTTIFALCFVLTFQLCRTGKQKSWGFLLFLTSIFVAFTRIYLSQHFLEDVMAGASIAVVFSSVLLIALDKQKWFHNPKLELLLLNRKK